MLETIQRYFLDLNKPMNFNPHEEGSVVISSEKQFEEICAQMEENGIKEPTKLSEYQFYSRLLYYEKKYKEMSKT